MDNASKALIMAGAILIAIAIVGVGVYIFSSTSSITETGRTQIDSTAAQLANSTLRQYASSSVVTGSTLQNLLTYAASLNSQDVYPIKVAYATAAYNDVKDKLDFKPTYSVANVITPAAASAHESAKAENLNKKYGIRLFDVDGDGYYDVICILSL